MRRALPVLLLALASCTSFEFEPPPYRIATCAEMPPEDVQAFADAAAEWNAMLGFEAYVMTTAKRGDVRICPDPSLGPVASTNITVRPITVRYDPGSAAIVATHELGHVAGILHQPTGCMKQGRFKDNAVTDTDVEAFREIWGD